MIQSACKWITRKGAGLNRPDPVHRAIRNHQLAVARLDAATTACTELEGHVMASGLKAEECGLLVLEAWHYRMEWEAYYAMQSVLSTAPTTTTGVYELRKYVRKQLRKHERTAGHSSPSLAFLRTWETLTRFLGRED